MARRESREPGPSLFPFLSVLACLIGTLTLLIASLAIGQVAESLLDPREDSESSEHLEAQRAELRALRAQLRSAEQVGEELAAARAELRALGVDPSRSAAELRSDVQARRSAAQLASRLRQLEREDAELQGNVRGVEADLASERPRSDMRSIRILPHGSAPPLRPFFVECREEGMRIYDTNLRDSSYLSRGNLDDVARFRAFLQRVRAVRDGTVVFLIRPDGADTYGWAASQAGVLLVRHSKLPLPTQGTLEFGL
jgi:hypothetical protein